MAQCAHCKTETDLFDNGVPICLECSEEGSIKRKPNATVQEIRTILLQELQRATKRNSEAIREFEAVIDQFPSGLPHPDGVQRIKTASNALSITRKEMASAHNRLSDFLNRGIVPDELKRGGVRMSYSCEK
jgi:hypothetical protein